MLYIPDLGALVPEQHRKDHAQHQRHEENYAENGLDKHLEECHTAKLHFLTSFIFHAA